MKCVWKTPDWSFVYIARARAERETKCMHFPAQTCAHEMYVIEAMNLLILSLFLMEFLRFLVCFLESSFISFHAKQQHSRRAIAIDFLTTTQFLRFFFFIEFLFDRFSCKSFSLFTIFARFWLRLAFIFFWNRMKKDFSYKNFSILFFPSTAYIRLQESIEFALCLPKTHKLTARSTFFGDLATSHCCCGCSSSPRVGEKKRAWNISYEKPVFSMERNRHHKKNSQNR